jgi:hypothetical protein
LGARPLPYIIDHNAGGGGIDALVEKDLERFARIRLSIAANSLGDIDWWIRLFSDLAARGQFARAIALTYLPNSQSLAAKQIRIHSTIWITSPTTVYARS